VQNHREWHAASTSSDSDSCGGAWGWAGSSSDASCADAAEASVSACHLQSSRRGARACAAPPLGAGTGGAPPSWVDHLPGERPRLVEAQRVTRPALMILGGLMQKILLPRRVNGMKKPMESERGSAGGMVIVIMFKQFMINRAQAAANTWHQKAQKCRGNTVQYIKRLGAGLREPQHNPTCASQQKPVEHMQPRL